MRVKLELSAYNNRRLSGMICWTEVTMKLMGGTGPVSGQKAALALALNAPAFLPPGAAQVFLRQLIDIPVLLRLGLGSEFGCGSWLR